MNDYLSKPIDRSATLNCIARWTDDTAPSLQLVSSTGNDDHYVDEMVLQQLESDTAPDIVGELLGLYINDAKSRVVKILKAIAHKDLVTLEYETHTLSSSAAAHGNSKLFRLAKNIEQLCQKSDQQQALELASALPTVANISFHRLKQYLSDHGGTHHLQTQCVDRGL